MPRIESNATRSSSTGSSFKIPVKGIVLIGLIACAMGYAVYQYVQLNPTPRRATPAAQTAALNKPKDSKEARKAAFTKLNLTPEQTTRMESLVSETTSPQSFRKEMAKVLTPEQKKSAKQLAADAKQGNNANRKERKAKQERMTKGVSPAYLEKAQADAKARRATAKAANTTAATSN